MRLARLAVLLFCGLAAMGAARNHASQKEIDECKLLASQQDQQTFGARTPSDPDIRDVAQCMKAKGYMWVEDTAGVCETLAIVQCFERQ